MAHRKPVLVDMARRGVRDMTYWDIEFAEGDFAFIMVPAANRDP